MEIYIYNRERERLGILQSYLSVQWQKCYDERGEFLITLNETEDNFKNYQIGYLLYKTDDRTLGYIEYVSCKEGEMEIRGHLDNLDTRINYETSTIQNVEKDIYALINSNKRGLEITTSGKSMFPNVKIDTTETTYQALSDTIPKICKQSGLGYRMVKDNDTFGLFELYKGDINDNGVLSEEFNNLFVKEYTQNISKFKNYAVVAGAGENKDRKIVCVDRSNGQQRYEMFVDARDLQKKYKDSAGVEHEYTDLQYTTVMRQRGEQRLDEIKETKTFKIDYDVTNESFKYGKAWKLGDILKSKSSKYGFVKHVRASKIKEIYENDYKVIASLEEVTI